MDEQKRPEPGAERDQRLVQPDDAIEDLEPAPESSDAIVGGLPAVQLLKKQN